MTNRNKPEFHIERDEVLEAFWVAGEENRQITKNLDNLQLENGEAIEETVRELIASAELIAGEAGPVLSEKGRNHAREIIRRHRLAERLLTEIFAVGSDEFEREACIFEHILSENVTEKICTFLGHPEKCPHGRPIPKGDCCRNHRTKIRPILRRFHDFDIGEKGRISFISSSDHGRVSQLAALGIHPGAPVVMHQKQPAVVLLIGETTVSIDDEIAKDIYCRDEN